MSAGGPSVATVEKVASVASRDAFPGRLCDGCGAAFQPVRRLQKFCRPSCRKSEFRTKQLELRELNYIEPDPGRPE